MPKTAWTLIATLTLGLVLGAGGYATVTAQDAPDRGEALQAELAKTAATCLETMQRRLEAGSGSVEEYARWSWRAAETGDESAEPFKAHLNRMRRLEADMQKRVKAGAATEADVAFVRYHRLEAELILLDASDEGD
ncbi:MAG: hypothetical protein R3F62_01705 [Planctomycetota bacterium]